MITERMVVMANQIADNVPDRARVAEQTAAHLRAFWPPAMRQALLAHADAGLGDLSPDVLVAVDLLREPV